MAITARNAATRPAIPLTELAAELRELGLEMLDHDTDPAASLPTVLSWSLRWLTDEQRTLFALLSIAPGPDTTQPAVASLVDLPTNRVRKMLSALEEASLIERRSHGRYAMHDLIRDYGASIAHTTLSDSVREAALMRVMDFYLHTAHAVDRLLDPHSQLVPLDDLTPGARPLSLPDLTSGMAWLDTEHATLLATQRAAVALGRHHIVWQLAWTLDTFRLRRGHLRDTLAAWRAAVNAAAHLPDPAPRIRAHRHLGYACSRLGLHEQAAEHLHEALDLAMRHHALVEQANTHRALALAGERRGDDQQALNHARHALDLFRILDQPVREADSLNVVGWLAARLGDFGTARDHCQDALALHRQHRDHPDGKADTLDTLGLIAHRTGNQREAIDHYHEALTLYRALGNAHQIAGALEHIGQPYVVLGHHDQARTVWSEALTLYREQGRLTDAARVQQQLDGLTDTSSSTG